MQALGFTNRAARTMRLMELVVPTTYTSEGHCWYGDTARLFSSGAGSPASAVGTFASSHILPCAPPGRREHRRVAGATTAQSGGGDPKEGDAY